MPVFFAVTAILAVVQLSVLVASLIGKGVTNLWLRHHAGVIAVICAAAVAFEFSILVLSTFRAAGRLPSWLAN